MNLEPLESRTLLTAAPAPFALGGSPLVHPEDFRVTTFAAGVDFPQGMQQLSDGSYVLPTTTPTPNDPNAGYFNDATGSLVRLTDVNNTGTADATRTVLATGMPSTLTCVRYAGRLCFVISPGAQMAGPATITVLRTGRHPWMPYTQLGTLTINFPQPWEHLSYALATRPTPGRPGSYDVFFNVGAKNDTDASPLSPAVTVSSSDGNFSGNLTPDSIYKFTVTDSLAGPQYSGLVEVAHGLRNAAGMAFDATTGDLYLEDNGIDGANIDPQASADELNVIPAAQIANGNPPDFGFPTTYVDQQTGQQVGNTGTPPLVAYTPQNGIRSEGPQDVVFAPSTWPAGLNRGVVMGFFGLFAYGGSNTNNVENPVVFTDTTTGSYFHLIEAQQAALAHPSGLLGTSNALFISDLTSTNDFVTPGTGNVYEISAAPRPYTIAGIAYVDANTNGTLDRHDAALRRATVYLDANDNGQFDSGERTATTDRHGNYAFTLPLAGTYAVRVIPPPGDVTSGAAVVSVSLRNKRGHRGAFAVNLGVKAGPTPTAVVRPATPFYVGVFKSAAVAPLDGPWADANR